MKRSLQKLISFSTALTSLLCMTAGNASAYVSEPLAEAEYDELVHMRDKAILVDKAEDSDEVQLVIIDENGKKTLVDQSLGINGVYSYVSKDKDTYNYISTENSTYSFDYFDDSYRLSTEQNSTIVGVGDKFAVMNDSGKLVSGLYRNIYRINDDYFIIDEAASEDENITGLMRADGTVIAKPADGVIAYYLCADGNHFLVKTEWGDYIINTSGAVTTDTYALIQEAYTADHDEGEKYKWNYILEDHWLVVNDGGHLGSSSNAYMYDGELVTRFTYHGTNSDELDGWGIKLYNYSGGDWVYDLIDSKGNILVDNADSIWRTGDSDDSETIEVERGNVTYTYDKNMALVSYSIKEEEDDEDDEPVEVKYEFDYGYVTVDGTEVTIWNEDGSKSNILEVEASDSDYYIYSVSVSAYSYVTGGDIRLTIRETNYYDSYDYNYIYKDYKINSDLEAFDVTGCKYVTDDYKILKENSESPYKVVDYYGNKLLTLPDDFTSFYSYSSTYLRFDSDTAFSIYDLELNPIFENVEGHFSGNYYYKNETDAEGNEVRKYGLINVDKKIITDTNYDNISNWGIQFVYDPFRDYLLAEINGTVQIIDRYDLNILKSWDSDFCNYAAAGNKLFLTLEDLTLILDSDMNIIRSWEGSYSVAKNADAWGSFTGCSYVSMNKRENGVTSTISYDPEEDAVVYEQEGKYDYVDHFRGEYAEVTNYAADTDSNDFTTDSSSETNSYGLIDLNGTEYIIPSPGISASAVSYYWNGVWDRIYVQIYHNYGYTRTDSSGNEYDYMNDYEYVHIPIEDLSPEVAKDYGYTLAWKNEAGNYMVLKDGLWGMIAPDGTVLIEPQYYYFDGFYDGLAEMRIGSEDKYIEYDASRDYTYKRSITYSALIDMYGNVIVEPFNNLPNPAYFRTGDPMNYDKTINKTSVGSYSTGYTYVYQVRQIRDDGTIDLTDYTAADVLNDFARTYGYDIARQEGDFYYVEKDGLAGIVTAANVEVVPMIYRDILSFEPTARTSYVPPEVEEILKSEFTSKLHSTDDGGYLVYVRDTNNKVGVLKISATAADPPPSSSTDPYLSPVSMTLFVGETDEAVTGNIPEGTAIKWVSNNSTVAKVDDGKITAIRAGTATIYAIYDSKFLTCEVTVKEGALTTTTSITTSTSTTTTTATSTTTSTSTTTTTATTTSTTTSASGITTVTTTTSISPSVNEPYIVPERLTMTVGDTNSPYIMNLPENSSIRWISNNTSVAAVDDGVVTALSPGTATIYAICGSTLMICEVTVISGEVSTTTVGNVPVPTVTTTTTATVPPAAIPLGDIDNDGAVNAIDASLVLTEYAMLATGNGSTLTDEQKEAADVNSDGSIDALDASDILGYYAYTATGGKGSLLDYLKQS